MVIVSAVHNFIITRNAVSISTHAAWAHVNTLLSRHVSLGEAGSVWQHPHTIASPDLAPHCLPLGLISANLHLSFRDE